MRSRSGYSLQDSQVVPENHFIMELTGAIVRLKQAKGPPKVSPQSSTLLSKMSLYIVALKKFSSNLVLHFHEYGELVRDRFKKEFFLSKRERRRDILTFSLDYG